MVYFYYIYTEFFKQCNWEFQIRGKFEEKCEDFSNRSESYGEKNRSILTKKLSEVGIPYNYE